MNSDDCVIRMEHLQHLVRYLKLDKYVIILIQQYNYIPNLLQPQASLFQSKIDEKQ